MATRQAAVEEVNCGAVLVNTGRVMIVDPCCLPDDMVAALTTPNEHGNTNAVVVCTPFGDGLYQVVGVPGCLEVRDPYAEPGDRTPGGGWYPDGEYNDEDD